MVVKGNEPIGQGRVGPSNALKAALHSSYGVSGMGNPISAGPDSQAHGGRSRGALTMMSPLSSCAGSTRRQILPGLSGPTLL